MKLVSVAASFVLLGQGAAFATSCDVYPQSIGQTVIDTPAGIKIFSTAQASVPLDDADLQMEAITEATMLAKASIVSFIKETISMNCKTNSDLRSSINITAEGKSVDVEKVKTIICSLENSTSGLLRGAVTLGDCYTPGQYVRVTVGIKPETIAQAGQISDQINQKPGNGTTNRFIKPQPRGSLNNMGGYSNDSRIYDF